MSPSFRPPWEKQRRHGRLPAVTGLLTLAVAFLFGLRMALAQAPDDAPPGAPSPSEGTPPSGTPTLPAAAAVPGSPAPLAALPPRDAELARGKLIAAVKIAGNKRISNEEIEGLLKWLKASKPFDPNGATSDVRDLWDSGNFDDIEVDLTSSADEVTVRLLLRERPSVKEVKFKGNLALSEDDLAEVVKSDLKTGNIFKSSEVRRTIQKLRDKYAEEGRFLAEIDYEVVPQKDNQVTLVFTVREHEKVTVRRVTFIGNDSIPEAELRENTQTGRIGLLSFGSGGPFRQECSSAMSSCSSPITTTRAFSRFRSRRRASC